MNASAVDDWLDEVRRQLHRRLDGTWQDPGYAGGAAGQLLCLVVLEAEAQQRGLTQGLDRDWIETQLARMLSLSWRLPHSLFQGMQGVLYAVQSLSQGFSLTGFVDDLDDADALLLDALQRDEGLPEHFDVIGGISGLLIYSVHRERCGAGPALVRACLQRLAAMSRQDGMARSWFTQPAWIRGFPMGDANPLGCTDLGVAHGQAGVLGALALATACSPANRPYAAELLQGLLVFLRRHEQQGCDWHFSSAAELPGATRCAWCYGDLGMAGALRLAAVALADPALDDWADRLIDSLQRRPALQLGFVDAWMCHGSLGSAWMLEQIAPGRRGRLVDECLRFQPIDALLQQLRSDPEAPLGLLEGHSGVAVAMAEARGLVAPVDWSLPFLAGRRALQGAPTPMLVPA